MSLKPNHILYLSLLAIFGCGLGMESADRLERGQQAYMVEEYRAAIIDAKSVLQEEPQNVDARLLLGRASLEVGDGVSAEIELRRAIELGTRFAAVAVDLGRAMLLQEKYDDVIAEIDPDLIEDKSGRILAMRMRGDSYLALRQPVVARETYSAVLREDNENKAALLGVVQSYIGERNLMQARQTLDQVLEMGTEYVPAWIASGSLNAQMGDGQRAEKDFTTAVRLANEASESQVEMMALFGLADTLLNLGRHGEIQATLERMNEISPEDLRTLMTSARFAAAESDWAEAQRILQQVLRLAPDYRPAQLLLGAVHKENGNLAQAEMYLAAVVADTPDNAVARRLLVETRFALNKTDEAEQALAPLIAGDDADAGSFSMAAAISLQSGEIDAATELLQRGISADPGGSDLQLQLAFVHFQAGNNDEARKVLQNITAVSSERTEFQRDSLLVLTQLAQGQMQEGKAAVEAIVSRWPDRAEAHNLLGFVLTIGQDLVAARTSFNVAAELMPDGIGPLWFLAQIDELENDPQSAERRYQAILDIQPRGIQAMVAMARLAVRREDFESAKDWLEKARNTDENAVIPRKALGTLLVGLKDFASAEEVTREALKIDGSDAGLYNILGLTELNQDNIRGAETSFGRAIELDPDNPAYRLNLSKAQSRSGDTQSAIATLEESTGEDFKDISSGLVLAALKVEVGAVDEAMSIALRLKQIYPDAAAPHVLEAELLSRQGDLIGAASAYDSALLLERSPRYAVRAYQVRKQARLPRPVEPLVTYLQERPLDTDMRIYLAQAYQNQNDISNSITEYEKVLVNAPGNFTAVNNLAWNYFTVDDPRAEEVARLAYEMQPENSSVVDTLGWILVSKGDYQSGILLLRNAVELGGGRAVIRYHLAAALAGSGEPQEAKSILQDVLSEPDRFAGRQEAEELLSTL